MLVYFKCLFLLLFFDMFATWEIQLILGMRSPEAEYLEANLSYA